MSFADFAVVSPASLSLASEEYVDYDTCGFVSMMNSLACGRTAMILWRVHTRGIMDSLISVLTNGYWSSHVLNISRDISCFPSAFLGTLRTKNAFVYAIILFRISRYRSRALC